MAGVELEKSVAKEWGGEVERSRGKQKRQACEAYKQAVKGYGCGLCVCVVHEALILGIAARDSM